MPVGQIPTESSRNPAMVRNWSDLTKMAGIRPDPTKIAGIRPDLGKMAGIQPDLAKTAEIRRSPAEIRRQLHFHFSYEPNAKKYFRENYFF
jgi:hypothetical protein